MAAISDTKDRLKLFKRRLLKDLDVPNLTKVFEAIENYPMLQGDADNVDPESFDEIANSIEIAASSGLLNSLPRRHFIVGCHLLWHPDFEFCNNANVIDFYRDRVRQSSGKAIIKSVVRGLLFNWRDDLEEFGDFARLTKNIVSVQNRGWLSDVYNAELLEGQNSMKRIAIEALKSANNCEQYLNRQGLTYNMLTGSFSQKVFESMCLENSKRPTIAGYEALFNFFSFGDEFRFDHKKAEFISSCLRPWVLQPAPVEIKEYLLEELRSVFRDPRLNPSHWHGVPENEKRVMFRWLAGESLDLFLDIVDRSAVERMWKFRRAFWMAYFEKEIITEAWVVFGEKAKGIYDSVYLESAQSKEQIFGTLKGGEYGHSVLLMRMGDYTVAEWSHNGQVWIWEPGQEGRPPPSLYRRLYRKEDCRGAAGIQFGVSHLSSDTMSWQRKVSYEISQLTGRNISLHELRP